ncbi:MAG: nitrate- and nitrite sensing domain-containing protein, partial [Venatoribacter sp.]
MNWLNNLSIRSKLLLLTFPPTLLLVLVFGYRITLDYQQQNAMQELAQEVKFLSKIDPVITELQRERGRSSAYLSGDTDRTKSVVLEQQKKTDRAVFAMKQESLYGSNTNIGSVLSNLQPSRNAILERKVSSEAAIDYFNNTIDGLMKHTDKVVRSVGVAEILRLINTYSALSELTEKAGRERAMGVAYIQGNDYQAAKLAPVLRAQGQQDNCQAMVDTLLKPEEIAFWQESLNSSENQNFIKLRDSLYAAETLAGLTPEHWIDSATSRIDRLTESKQKILNDVLALALDLQHQAFVALWGKALVMLLVILSGT